MQQPKVILLTTLLVILGSEAFRVTAAILKQVCCGEIDRLRLVASLVGSDCIATFALLAVVGFLSKTYLAAGASRRRQIYSRPLECLMALTLAIAAGFMFSNFSKTTAFACELTGQYELGEFFYSVNPRREAATTLAQYADYRHDLNKNELKTQRVSKTVARVYGASSIEMGHRYYSLAKHYMLFLEDNLSAEKYYLKALRIFRDHDDHLNSALVLGALACVQVQNQHVGQSMELVKEADSHMVYVASDETRRANERLDFFLSNISDKVEGNELLRVSYRWLDYIQLRCGFSG